MHESTEPSEKFPKPEAGVTESKLNLIDICKDVPKEVIQQMKTANMRKYFDVFKYKILEEHPITGFVEMERQGFENLKEIADTTISGSANVGQALDNLGTRNIEKKYGKSFLTKGLDKSRKLRYRLAEDIVQGTVDDTIDTLKDKVLKRISKVLSDAEDKE